MVSIQQRRTDVQLQFLRVLAIAEGNSNRKLLEVESALWTSLLTLGRMLVLLYLTHVVSQNRDWEYSYDGQKYTLGRFETLDLGTRFGKIAFVRPCGRADGGGPRDYCFDRKLGLCSGFSLGVVAAIAKLAAQMPFGAARKSFLEVYEWAPGSRAVLRMVDGVAAQSRAFIDWSPPPSDDGEVMVLLADGKGAPTLTKTELARRKRKHGPHLHNRAARRVRRREMRLDKPRRQPGDKSKNAKMAAVGVIYTLKLQDGRLEGPLNKRVYATFVSYRALFEWLDTEAKKRGLGTERITKLLFIADGADILWSLQQEFFPQAQMCLDWFHVVEKLWLVGKVLIPSNRQQLETWVREQKRCLREGNLKQVLELLRAELQAIPVTGPGNKKRRETLTNILCHFTKNAERMQYAKLREQDFEIGSGVVEGAVRHLVGMRHDGPGMRWGLDRMEAVLQLRTIVINEQWTEFVQHLDRQQQVRIPAEPVAARAHEAKRKMAA